MPLFDLLLIACGCLGHVAIWSALTNRMHGFVVARKRIWTGRLAICTLNAGIPVLWAASYIRHPQLISDPGSSWPATVSFVYWAACAFFAVRTVAAWWVQQRPGRAMTSPRIESNHTEVIDLQHDLDRPLARSTKAKLLARVPRNEIFDLATNVKTIRLRRLPSALDGLTITHLSDLHISKHMEPAFYELIVEHANQFGSDLVLITGDLIDGARQIDLTVRVLGQLQANLGVYYIFGNHEIRLATSDIATLDRKLEHAGLIHLVGSWCQIDVCDEPVILAGNSLPWYGLAPDMNGCSAEDPPGGPLRILLSHSPDQINWARTHQFDLMLAGHTHGGQVRFPLVGPILCPSRYGGKYAAGVFDLPPTLLHVVRGVSGMTPLRFHCRPELTQLVLRM